jgi:hypothetical protein
LGAVLLGFVATIAIAPAVAQATATTFTPNGSTIQTYTVPAGVYHLSIEAVGGAGGGVNGGEGGIASAIVPVAPGQALNVDVGGNGATGGISGGAGGAFGGGGGGTTGLSTDVSGSGGGGESSVSDTMTGSELVVGGGGGGQSGGGTFFSGGDAGYPAGQAGGGGGAAGLGGSQLGGGAGGSSGYYWLTGNAGVALGGGGGSMGQINGMDTTDPASNGDAGGGGGGGFFGGGGASGGIVQNSGDGGGGGGSGYLTSNAVDGHTSLDTTATPEVEIAPYSYSALAGSGAVTFASTPESGTSAPGAITFTNTNPSPLQVTGWSFAATGGQQAADDFSVGAQTCGGVLSSGASCTLWVRFTPQQSSGVESSALVVDALEPVTGQTFTSSVALTATATTVPTAASVPTGTTTTTTTTSAAISQQPRATTPTTPAVKLSRLRLSTRSLAAGAPVTVSFELTQAAEVSVAVEHRTGDRWTMVRWYSVTRLAGRRTVTLASPKLAPGSYRVVVTARRGISRSKPLDSTLQVA